MIFNSTCSSVSQQGYLNDSADDGLRGVLCQLKSLTHGLWGSPWSLKGFFGIIHRSVFALPPENPAKRKQPRSNALECRVRFPVWIYLSTLWLILVCSSTQNRKTGVSGITGEPSRRAGACFPCPAVFPSYSKSKHTPSKQRFPSEFPALRHLPVSFSVLARYLSVRRRGIFNIHKGSVLVECLCLPPGDTLIHVSMQGNEAIHTFLSLFQDLK